MSKEGTCHAIENSKLSIEIAFSNLWTYEGANTNDRLPLSRLSKSGGHIHGRLQINVDGKALPYLGYFGLDDVCFNEWAFELKSALKNLRASMHASYTYDEGEQGQPAFLFEREGKLGFISIVASQLSDGAADRKWQRVPFDFSEFEHNVERFLVLLREHIEAASPKFSEQWWSNIAERER